MLWICSNIKHLVKHQISLSDNFRMLNAIADKMLMGSNSDKTENALKELSEVECPQLHRRVWSSEKVRCWVLIIQYSFHLLLIAQNPRASKCIKFTLKGFKQFLYIHFRKQLLLGESKYEIEEKVWMREYSIWK